MRRKNHISIIIFMITLSLYCSYHIYYYFLDTASDDLIRGYYINDTIFEKKPDVKRVSNEVKEEYLGILKIPKIHLQEGFYDINSKNNNVNKAVTILKESTFPSSDGGIIFLTAHSGYGYLAFFKDLNKLEINDVVNIDINKHSYWYIINDIYEEEKNGKITVDHNIHENYLVLSTCSNKKDKQLVIIGKLMSDL